MLESKHWCVRFELNSKHRYHFYYQKEKNLLSVEKTMATPAVVAPTAPVIVVGGGVWGAPKGLAASVVKGLASTPPVAQSAPPPAPAGWANIAKQGGGDVVSAPPNNKLTNGIGLQVKAKKGFAPKK